MNLKNEVSQIQHYGSKYKSDIGEYALTGMPGCPWTVCISHDAFVPEELRGQGFGQLLHKQRLNKMRDMGYSFAICTVNADNEAQKKILNKNGWYHLWTFQEHCEGHNVSLYGRIIEAQVP